MVSDSTQASCPEQANPKERNCSAVLGREQMRATVSGQVPSRARKALQNLTLPMMALLYGYTNCHHGTDT